MAKVLDDNLTMADYMIGNHAYIQSFVRLRGGSRKKERLLYTTVLRMRIGFDFTTLVQHSGCAGYIRLVWADTIPWCWALLYPPLLLCGGCSDLLFV